MMFALRMNIDGVACSLEPGYRMVKYIILSNTKMLLELYNEEAGWRNTRIFCHTRFAFNICTYQ